MTEDFLLQQELRIACRDKVPYVATWVFGCSEKLGHDKGFLLQHVFWHKCGTIEELCRDKEFSVVTESPRFSVAIEGSLSRQDWLQGEVA